jgi:hypothetical protein
MTAVGTTIQHKLYYNHSDIIYPSITIKVLRCVDPLLGNDRERSSYTTVTAK